MRVGQVNMAGHAASMGRLTAVLADKTEDMSPLERARRALLKAKENLERHRDERIEEALPGYRALCSRRNSYEEHRDVTRKDLEAFQTLSARRESLAGGLSSARAGMEAGAEARPDGLLSGGETRRTAALEEELAAVEGELSALVERANRYASSQRQYAAYLEKTGQSGYAAFVYRDRPELTGETFLSGTAELAKRFEAGAAAWNERASRYCEGFGLTASDFERYLEERSKLGGVYAGARQRYMELLNTAGSGEAAGGFDRVELRGPRKPDPPETPPAERPEEADRDETP